MVTLNAVNKSVPFLSPVHPWSASIGHPGLPSCAFKSDVVAASFLDIVDDLRRFSLIARRRTIYGLPNNYQLSLCAGTINPHTSTCGDHHFLITCLAARWLSPKDSARHLSPCATSIAGFSCTRSDNASVGLDLLENNMYAALVSTCRNSHRGIYGKRGNSHP